MEKTKILYNEVIEYEDLEILKSLQELCPMIEAEFGLNDLRDFDKSAAYEVAELIDLHKSNYIY